MRAVCASAKFNNLLVQKTSRIAKPFRIDLHTILAEFDINALEICLGDKSIKIFSVDQDRNGEPLAWFTPDKLVYDHWRQHLPHDVGLGDVEDVTRFEALYVGISKKDDSHFRLFGKGHVARSRILSQEAALEHGALLSEEVSLFLFEVVPLIHIAQVEFVDGQPVRSSTIETDRLLADAEKALIHILRPRYNDERYVNYPRSRDGLFNKGFQSYMYFLDEELTFVGPAATLRGARSPNHPYSIIDVDHERALLLEKVPGAHDRP